MRSAADFVHEQYLRERFPGWCVPGAVIHRGVATFVYQPDDGIDIPQHGVCVLRADHDAWLRAGHDPGDEQS